MHTGAYLVSDLSLFRIITFDSDFCREWLARNTSSGAERRTSGFTKASRRVPLRGGAPIPKLLANAGLVAVVLGQVGIQTQSHVSRQFCAQ